MSMRSIASRVSELSQAYAPIILALYIYAYALRGGALLFGFINLTLVFLLLMLACVGFPLVFDRGSVRYRFSWADAAVAALGLVMLVNSSSAEGFEKALRFNALVLTAYFAARLALVDTGRVRKFLYTIAAAASALALLGLVVTFAPGAIEGTLLRDAFHGDRLIFIQTNPIPLAIFLMAGGLILIGFMPGLGARAKLLAGAVFIIVVFMLFQTGSRGSVLGTLMALAALLGIAVIRRSARHLWPIVFGFTIVAALLYLFYGSGDDPDSELFAIGSRFRDLTSPRGDPSIEGRLELFAEAIDKFLDNPLRGAGTDGMDVYAHNVLLETAAELGLLGLVPLLALLCLVSLNLVRFALRAKIRGPNLDVAAAVALLFVSLFSVSQFSGSLASNKDLFGMFAIIINFPLLFGLTGRQGASPPSDRVESRPLKALHVIPSMSPEWGGPVAAVGGLSAELARRGVRCEIATTRGHRSGADAVRVPGVPVHVFDTGPAARVWTGYSRSLARFIDAEIARFDLVHIHELWSYGGYAAYRAARKQGIPYVLSVHGELSEWALRQKSVKKWVYMKAVQERILRSADTLHALVRAEAVRIEELGLKAPVFVAPNGISPDALNAFGSAYASRLPVRYPQLAGKRVILFLGRLHVKKGLDVLARSFARVAREFEDAALLVAGPDEDGSGGRMEAELRRLGVVERAVFTGMLTGGDKLAAFAIADVFVLPSYSEGFSVTTLEALAAGLPVVISEGCNFPEAAEKEAGFVVPAEAAPVAEAIGALLSDESLRTRMGLNGRRLIEECYTWPAVAESMEGMYRSIVERGRPF